MRNKSEKIHLFMQRMPGTLTRVQINPTPVFLQVNALSSYMPSENSKIPNSPSPTLKQTCHKASQTSFKLCITDVIMLLSLIMVIEAFHLGMF